MGGAKPFRSAARRVRWALEDRRLTAEQERGVLARVLAPGGVAVIHHADGRNRGLLPSRQGWRAPMSRKLFATLATERDLRVERQLDSWGSDGRHDLGPFGDAISVLRRE